MPESKLKQGLICCYVLMVARILNFFRSNPSTYHKKIIKLKSFMELLLIPRKKYFPGINIYSRE